MPKETGPNHSIELHTDDLLLRKFRADDAADMFRNWASKDEVTQFLTWRTHQQLSETQAVIARWLGGYEFPRFYVWALDLDGEVIGSIGCSQPDMNLKEIKLGYALSPLYWGKGYMTQAVIAIVDYLFSLGYNRIAADHYLENPASGRVMQKAGMQFEGIIRDGGRDGFGNFRDVKQYAIVHRDLGHKEPAQREVTRFLDNSDHA